MQGQRNTKAWVKSGHLQVDSKFLSYKNKGETAEALEFFSEKLNQKLLF